MVALIHKALVLLMLLAISNGTTAPVFAQQNQKSPAKAFLYSFLVPGLGHYYVENVGKACLFITADVILFGMGIGHTIYSETLEDDFKAFGAAHAGFDPAGKDKDYFIAASRFLTIYDYNNDMRLNRDFDKVLPETPGIVWSWDSPDNRTLFLQRRIDAKRIKNRRNFYFAGMFLNHVLSGIHASFMAKRFNARLPQTGWNVRFHPPLQYENPTHSVQVTYRF